MHARRGSIGSPLPPRFVPFSPPDFLRPRLSPDSLSLSLSLSGLPAVQRSRKILARMEFVQFREEGTTTLSLSLSVHLLFPDRRQRFCGLKPGKSCIHERTITGAALRFASLPRFPSFSSPTRSPSISHLNFALSSEAAVYEARAHERSVIRGKGEGEGEGHVDRGGGEGRGRAKIRQSYSPRYDTNNKNHKHSDPLIKSSREDVPKPPFPEMRIVS